MHLRIVTVTSSRVFYIVRSLRKILVKLGVDGRERAQNDVTECIVWRSQILCKLLKLCFRDFFSARVFAMTEGKMRAVSLIPAFDSVRLSPGFFTILGKVSI